MVPADNADTRRNIYGKISMDQGGRSDYTTGRETKKNVD